MVVGEYNITNTNLDGEQYKIRIGPSSSNNLAREYEVLNENDDTVIEGMDNTSFENKRMFSFTNSDGEDAFAVDADELVNIGGEYSVVDLVTEEKVVKIEDSFNILNPQSGDKLGSIKFNSHHLSAIKNLDISSLSDTKYEIFDNQNRKTGQIVGEGELPRMTVDADYSVSIQRPCDIPTESIIAVVALIYYERHEFSWYPPGMF